MLMMNNLSPDQRVQKAVIDIMANPRYVALAGVLMIGSRRVEHDATKCPDCVYQRTRRGVWR
jgi:hypothetical protein